MESLAVLLARGTNRRRLRAEPSYFKLVRERAGLTQLEIAALLNVDRSAISRWENGLRLPRPVALDRYGDLIQSLEEVDQK